MKQSHAEPPEPHPFEQFKETMRKLVKVSKADLDAKLKEHNATKPERKAGRRPKKPLNELRQD
jgi:hypothetical protein